MTKKTGGQRQVGKVVKHHDSAGGQKKVVTSNPRRHPTSTPPEMPKPMKKKQDG